MKIMEFKDFDKTVKSYNTLRNNRFLVIFIDSSFEFYSLTGNRLIKEVLKTRK